MIQIYKSLSESDSTLKALDTIEPWMLDKYCCPF